MNWTKVSAISDVIVAISVIVSLIYVASQLEQNTKALQLAAVVNTTEMWTNQQVLLAQDKELNELFWNGMKGDDSLSELDQKRYEAFMSGWVQAFQQSFLLQESGNMNAGLWENQFQSMRWVFSNPGAIKYWAKWKSNHVPSYVKFVDKRIMPRQPETPKNASNAP